MKPMTTLAVLFCLIINSGCQAYIPMVNSTPKPVTFDGAQAFQDVEKQVGFGPRTPDSNAHQQALDWMTKTLQQAGWTTEIEQGTEMGHPYQNLVAKRGSGSPWIILGAHYDSRTVADHDPDPQKRTTPVPGANDGASGVAVLLGLARSLPDPLVAGARAGQVWLVFFDNEDNGDLPGSDWSLGSKAFAAGLQGKPDAVVVLDMIGDRDLQIYRERNSTPTLVDEIWNTAKRRNHEQFFIPQAKYTMIDDHLPFLRAGIAAVDIIDFDYPYWHTTADTADKVSAESLSVVGDTLLAWLTQPGK
jgi:glutaminyl-peptide cyclotransferase